MINKTLKNEATGLVMIVGTYLFGVLTMFALTLTKFENFETDFKNAATQTQCAQYNPVTGEFEWIDDFDIMIKDIEND